MAEIHITALGHCSPGGPHVSLPLWARLVEKWLLPPGAVVPVLQFVLGNDVVEVWPADPARVRELSDKLLMIADELERK